MIQRRFHYIISGQVQGVGFRPFIYRLATERSLSGSVRNSPEGVLLELQGDGTACADFERALHDELPPLAKIDSLQRSEHAALVRDDSPAFSILPSLGSGEATALISPDMAICSDCLSDMQAGRRFLYSFTNCTNCGPRYSIVRRLPYDRQQTSMACFALCDECKQEYDNPLDRRFHAQPNACHKCGPKLWLLEGADLEGGQCYEQAALRDEKAMQRAAELLLSGSLLAMKGLGGFHLVCNAENPKAVKLLRERKQRPHKAFAVMVASLAEAHKLACLRPEDEALLLSPERPIVLCQKKGCITIAAEVAPDNTSVGLMLPYTPMQVALFDCLARLCGASVPALVMTSGNRSGQPLCVGNREALRELACFADAFLLHNRDIVVRIDDSVVAASTNNQRGQEKQPGLIFYRRARGYVPAPIELLPLRPSTSGLAAQAASSGIDLSSSKSACVLAFGAELKNTFCLTRGTQAFVSQHIGDLDNFEVLEFQRETINHLCDLLQVRPQLLVHDLHPDFLSTRLAEELADEWGVKAVPLQHHFAHARSVAAEHKLEDAFLCLALDGSGYGEDGSIWGGELLLVDPLSTAQKRIACLEPLPLPGGDLAVRQPWRIAFAALEHFGLCYTAKSRRPWLDEQQQEESPMISAMLRRSLNTPMSSSCGRLFDAVSAICGLCSQISYEGQAAILLEQAQGYSHEASLFSQYNGFSQELFGNAKHRQNFDKNKLSVYRFSTEMIHTGDNKLCRLSLKELFMDILHDIEHNIDNALISRRFHFSLAHALAEVAQAAATENRIKTLVLAGGCLQNQTLLALLVSFLRSRGLRVLWPEQLPPGDGGLSLGQAAYARLLL